MTNDAITEITAWAGMTETLDQQAKSLKAGEQFAFSHDLNKAPAHADIMALLKIADRYGLDVATMSTSKREGSSFRTTVTFTFTKR